MTVVLSPEAQAAIARIEADPEAFANSLSGLTPAALDLQLRGLDVLDTGALVGLGSAARSGGQPPLVEFLLGGGDLTIPALTPQQASDLSRATGTLVSPQPFTTLNPATAPAGTTRPSFLNPNGPTIQGSTLAGQLGVPAVPQDIAMAIQEIFSLPAIDSQLGFAGGNPDPFGGIFGGSPLPQPTPTFPTGSTTAAGGASGSGGGILGTLGDILGGVVSGGGVDGEGDFGILGDLGGLLGGVFGGGGGTGGGGGSAAGTLLGGLLGAFFGDDLSESRQEFRRALPAASPQELALLGINTDLANRQLGAFATAQGAQGIQSQFLQQLFQDQQDRESGFQFGLGSAGLGGFSPSSIRGLSEFEALGRRAGLVGGEEQIQQGILQDFLRGNQASPEDLARIQRSSDLAIQSGLSDLSRFRDDQLEAIRLSAAGRGLRPSDTPILNQFEDLSEETTRNAEQLIRGIRGQQANQELLFPLQRGQLGLGQFAAQSDALARRRAQDQAILDRSQQERLGLGGLGTQFNLGLAPSAFPGTQAQGILATTRGQQGTTTGINSPDALTGFGRVAGTAGDIFDALGLFG